MFELVNSVAAANGAMFLDNVEPGWFDKVNLDRLDLTNEKNCVLGQVFGEYWSALDDLELSVPDAMDLGFTADEDMLSLDRGYDLYDEAFLALNAAWRLLIEERVQNALLDRLEASLGLSEVQDPFYRFLEAIA